MGYKVGNMGAGSWTSNWENFQVSNSSPDYKPRQRLNQLINSITKMKNSMENEKFQRRWR